MPDLYFYRDQEEIEKDEEVAQKAAEAEAEPAPQDWSEVSTFNNYPINENNNLLIVFI